MTAPENMRNTEIRRRTDAGGDDFAKVSAKPKNTAVAPAPRWNTGSARELSTGYRPHPLPICGLANGAILV